MAASRWLRSMYGQPTAIRADFEAQVVGTMNDASQYEERLASFAEAALALIDTGMPDRAGALIQRIAETADQAVTIASPFHLSDLLLHLMRIDQAVPQANSLETVLAHVTPAMIERLIAGEHASTVSAFLYYLFHRHLPQGQSRYASALEVARRDLLARVRSRSPEVSTALAETLLCVHRDVVDARLKRLGPETLLSSRPWELGLLEILYAAIYSVDDHRMFADNNLLGRLDPDQRTTRDRYFTGDVSNVKCALSLRSSLDVNAAKLTDDAIQQIAEERRIGERRTAVQWLLDPSFRPSTLRRYPYYLKLLLNETAFAAYEFDFSETLAEDVSKQMVDRKGRATSQMLGRAGHSA